MLWHSRADLPLSNEPKTIKIPSVVVVKSPIEVWYQFQGSYLRDFASSKALLMGFLYNPICFAENCSSEASSNLFKFLTVENFLYKPIFFGKLNIQRSWKKLFGDVASNLTWWRWPLFFFITVFSEYPNHLSLEARNISEVTNNEG